MRKLAAGILITMSLIIFVAFTFTLYGQFALDYSLESLKQALEASQEQVPSTLDSHTYHSSLEGLVFEEMASRETNFETVVLLEHAAHSIRDAVERSGYSRAGVYLAELLRERTEKRNWVLRTADSVYHFLKSFFKAIQDIWSYIWRKLHPPPPPTALGETGVLILNEAERKEREGKLEEAERYYREFVERFPNLPERGFVTISLAHVLSKLKQFDEAEQLLQLVQNEFRGTREEALATAHLARIAGIRRRLGRIPELENWLKSQPERLFEEKGGLELALDYLATYQTDRALAVLEKLTQAPDPRIRTKALFYSAWIHKWKGDSTTGKAILESLRQEPRLDEKLAFATEATLAEVHIERKEYAQAVNLYEEVSRKAAVESWKALSELEQSRIYFYGIGDREAARQSLLRLQQLLPAVTPNYMEIKQELEETFQKSLREEGFNALAQGRADTAFRLFEDYLKKFPRDGIVHSALATIYLLEGFLKDALEEAEKGFALERNEYTAAVLGYVYEKMKKLEEAKKYYAIGAKIRPSYTTTQYNLAWVYLVTGQYKQAGELFEKLEGLQLRPPPFTRAKILNNQGCVYWALGEKEKAMERFREALKVMPGLKEARGNLSLAAAGEQPRPAFIESPI